MSKVIIIGGGAAGMFASIMAASNGHEVHVYEKNEKLGKKLFITGKGRCNLTNACDIEELINSVRQNPKFMYSAFYGFNNWDVIDFFETAGMPTKIERGNRVFPKSDHSSDVIKTLERKMKSLGVHIYYNSEVSDLKVKEGICQAVVLKSTKIVTGDVFIVATGGLSYPVTGSTGDGYKFAKKIGHSIAPMSPCLVPFEISESFVKELQGLSLKNVNVKLYVKEQCVFSDRGEMMFTHFGITGPLILSASSYIQDRDNLKDLKAIKAVIDLKPGLTFEQLDQRVLRDFKENTNRQFKNSLGKLFPSKLIPVMIQLCNIHPEKKVHDITKEERSAFVRLIKNIEMTVNGLRDYNEAIITRGGVNVREINPATMESKKVKNILFAGEVLDVDAVTGGFNLQVAWSTAYAAAMNIT